ncbi:hypothetical protein JHK82_056644 [Glycine max]|nr:hypothetical protein JHK85_057485 [Glycine max]KAG5077949.1 hypothetical protein JHK82_056644 [Glycine max]
MDALKARSQDCPDFILIDCPAGIDAGFITTITPANEAVLISERQQQQQQKNVLSQKRANHSLDGFGDSGLLAIAL